MSRRCAGHPAPPCAPPPQPSTCASQDPAFCHPACLASLLCLPPTPSMCPRAARQARRALPPGAACSGAAGLGPGPPQRRPWCGRSMQQRCSLRQQASEADEWWPRISRTCRRTTTLYVHLVATTQPHLPPALALQRAGQTAGQDRWAPREVVPCRLQPGAALHSQGRVAPLAGRHLPGYGGNRGGHARRWRPGEAAQQGWVRRGAGLVGEVLQQGLGCRHGSTSPTHHPCTPVVPRWLPLAHTTPPASPHLPARPQLRFQLPFPFFNEWTGFRCSVTCRSTAGWSAASQRKAVRIPPRRVLAAGVQRRAVLVPARQAGLLLPAQAVLPWQPPPVLSKLNVQAA